MINYAGMNKLQGVKRCEVHDIISDVQSDLLGWAITLRAIADQDFVIEPQQLEPISASLHMASEALEEVNKTIDAIMDGATNDNGK